MPKLPMKLKPDGWLYHEGHRYRKATPSELRQHVRVGGRLDKKAYERMMNNEAQ